MVYNRLATATMRNQMTKAERFIGTSDTYVGKVEYRYCLSCDSALSERIEYSPSSSTTITSWRRYEYDGLNVLRVDEKYDTAGGTLDTNDPWRTIEVNTHKPGSLGALVGKRFYVHTNNDATPDQTNDYTYTYDAVGNVQVIYRASGSTGQEAYFFTQDAFGNELSSDANIHASNRTNLLGGATWATARTAGITEHQTGKIQSAFSGLYYFYARWYDPTMGRFVGRDPETHKGSNLYNYCASNPLRYVDITGKDYYPPCEGCSGIEKPGLVDLLRGPSNCLPFAIDTWAHALMPWVRDWANTIYPGDAKYGGWTENAMRHCLGQCILACKCGTAIADLASWWHELDVPPTDRDHIADLHNNEWGKRFAKTTHGCCAGCFCSCRDALTSGKLDTVSSNPN
ncbi:MAG: hypothetical protein DIKNOCCD_01201 [bacterium]|nr:hypothetical protein [bacterium]